MKQEPDTRLRITTRPSLQSVDWTSRESNAKVNKVEGSCRPVETGDPESGGLRSTGLGYERVQLSSHQTHGGTGDAGFMQQRGREVDPIR